MTVTFFGHGKNEYDIDIKSNLSAEIEKLIISGADVFLLGGYGNFDMIAANIVHKLKIRYPNIKSILVIPYINRKYYTDIYDETIYPDLENIIPKAAISERNKWMVNNSDIVVCYLLYGTGGSYKAVRYAKKLNKKIINIAENEIV